MKRFHVHVAVRDLDDSVRFYSTIFGAAPSVHKPDYAKWMLDDPRINFAISERSGHHGVNHLGFQVDDDAGLDVADAAEHVALGELLAAHRVLAGDDLDAGAQRFADAIADHGVGLQHPDARTVGDDLDVDILRAEARLQVARIVEREVPLAGVGVADLDDDAIFGGLLRERSGCHGGGDEHRGGAKEMAAVHGDSSKNSVDGEPRLCASGHVAPANVAGPLSP